MPGLSACHSGKAPTFPPNAGSASISHWEINTHMTIRTIRSIVSLSLMGVGLGFGQVTIVASSEFRTALEDIRKSFQEQTGIPTRATYGSSGAMSLRAKTPGTDIFLSADKKWTDSLASTPRADDRPVVLATIPVCVWVRGSHLDPSNDLTHLGEKSPGEIVIADTLLSPDAAEVVKVLHDLPNWPDIRRRLVMVPDPGAVVDSLTHLQPGETTTSDSTKLSDTAKSKKTVPAKKNRSLANGFMTQPLLWNNSLAGSGRWTPIDPALVPPLTPSVIRLKSLNAPRTDAAKAFLAFLQAPRARATLRANGFLPPP
jgi:ABC-type molybdate transport system substrate-binding protein